MKKFINDPFNVVDEMLEGFLQVHGGRVRRLEAARAVVRREVPVQGKVALITGGGSGHKPAFIGFIGEGMLDGVAVGDIFTSPPALAVYEAAKACHGGRGVLLLLGNYSGDVMNFQLAADMLAAEGVSVEQVIATDDVASAPKGQESRRRGVVGEWLAWKCCGAMAARGAELAEVKRIAMKINDWTRTMGVALAPCTVPAAGRPTFTLADDEMELGVGHHGEPGTERTKVRPADEVAEILTRRVVEDLPFGPGDEVAVLINGLGATPQLEMYIVYRKVAAVLGELGIRVGRSYVGEFFTALDMAGLSVTLMRLDDELKGLLDAPADTPAYVRQ